MFQSCISRCCRIGTPHSDNLSRQVTTPATCRHLSCRENSDKRLERLHDPLHGLCEPVVTLWNAALVAVEPFEDLVVAIFCLEASRWHTGRRPQRNHRL